jgi:hypothetical protein
MAGWGHTKFFASDANTVSYGSDVENRDTDTADMLIQVQLRDVMRLLHALYFNVTDGLKLENSVRLIYETNNWICLYHYDLDGRLWFAQLEAKFSCTSS